MTTYPSPSLQTLSVADGGTVGGMLVLSDTYDGVNKSQFRSRFTISDPLNSSGVNVLDNRTTVSGKMAGHELWANFEEVAHNVNGGDDSAYSAVITRYTQGLRYTVAPNIVQWAAIFSIVDLTGQRSALSGPLTGIELDLEASGVDDNSAYPRVALNVIGFKGRNYGGTDSEAKHGIQVYTGANFSWKQAIQIASNFSVAGINFTASNAIGSVPCILMKEGQKIAFDSDGTDFIYKQSNAVDGEDAVVTFGNHKITGKGYVVGNMTVGGLATLAGNCGVTGTMTASGAVTGASVKTGSTSGPSWTSGTGAPSATTPVGSLYSRTDGTAGARLYVSAGGGTWNPVANV